MSSIHFKRAQSLSWVSPGAHITPDEGALSTEAWGFMVSVGVLAIYNALELVLMVFLTFRRYSGLYFYSLLISSLAIIPYTIGFLLNLLDITTGSARWAAITLITIGWWPMVTGQSVVLWSRLHLILVRAKGDMIIRWTGYMIIVDAVVLHIPTTVLTFGSNGQTNTSTFATGCVFNVHPRRSPRENTLPSS